MRPPGRRAMASANGTIVHPNSLLVLPSGFASIGLRVHGRRDCLRLACFLDLVDACAQPDERVAGVAIRCMVIEPLVDLFQEAHSLLFQEDAEFSHFARGNKGIAGPPLEASLAAGRAGE